MFVHVGVRDLFRLRATSVEASFVTDPSTLPIASPWSTSSNLQRIVFEDIFGSDIPMNTRSAAMRLPAIVRGRHLIVSSIARMPLVQLRKGETAPAPDAQPSWITSALGGSSPQHRLAWIVDDLIFYGWSCLWRDNGAGGYPLGVQRIPVGDWVINADARVEIHGQPVADDQVILIPGFHEGILSYGSEVLADARSLYSIVRKRLKTPTPPVDLHQTGGAALTKAERDDLVESWVTARELGHNVGYTSKDIEAKHLPYTDDNQLMIEARNAASLDLARLIGITAGLIDATVAKASLNYETATGRNQEFVDRDLQLYMAPITARLSLDDVSPHGSRVAFDLADWTGPAPAPTGPALED